MPKTSENRAEVPAGPPCKNGNDGYCVMRSGEAKGRKMKALKEVWSGCKTCSPFAPESTCQFWTWLAAENLDLVEDRTLWPEDKEVTEVLMSRVVEGQNQRLQRNKKLGWLSPQELFSVLKLHEARGQRHDEALEKQEA